MLRSVNSFPTQITHEFTMRKYYHDQILILFRQKMFCLSLSTHRSLLVIHIIIQLRLHRHYTYAQKHPALRALCTRCSGDVLSSKEVNDSRLSYTFESRATGPRNHKWRWSLLTRFVERKHLRIRDVEISDPTRRVSYVLASIGHGSSGCIIECRSRKSVLALEEQHSIIHMCCN